MYRDINLQEALMERRNQGELHWARVIYVIFHRWVAIKMWLFKRWAFILIPFTAALLDYEHTGMIILWKGWKLQHTVWLSLDLFLDQL